MSAFLYLLRQVQGCNALFLCNDRRMHCLSLCHDLICICCKSDDQLADLGCLGSRCNENWHFICEFWIWNRQFLLNHIKWIQIITKILILFEPCYFLSSLLLQIYLVRNSTLKGWSGCGSTLAMMCCNAHGKGLDKIRGLTDIYIYIKYCLDFGNMVYWCSFLYAKWFGAIFVAEPPRLNCCWTVTSPVENKKFIWPT